MQDTENLDDSKQTNVFSSKTDTSLNITVGNAVEFEGRILSDDVLSARCNFIFLDENWNTLVEYNLNWSVNTPLPFVNLKQKFVSQTEIDLRIIPQRW